MSAPIYGYGYAHSDYCDCAEDRRCAGCQTWTSGKYCPRCEELNQQGVPMSNKQHIGDGVYVAVDAADRLILTTDNGAGPSMIILEPEVYANLQLYAARNAVSGVR